MKSKLHSLLTIFMAIAMWLQFGNSLYGGGCSSLVRNIQAIQGSGSDLKDGFVCGTGCNTHYYLARNCTDYSKDVIDIYILDDSGCGYRMHEHLEITEKTGQGQMSYFRLDSLSPCAKHYTEVDNSASWIETVSHSWDEPDCYPCQFDHHECGYESVDGVITGDPSCESSLIYIPPNDCHPIRQSWDTTTTGEAGCQVTTDTEVWAWQGDGYSYLERYVTIPNSTYQDEYTTDMCIQRAKGCADFNLQNQSWPADCSKYGDPSCGENIADDSNDSKSASVTKARWRLAICGANSKTRYKITLHWNETINGVSTTFTEPYTATGTDDPCWYWPSAGGQDLNPKDNSTCGYKYSKALTDAEVTPID